jgi:hypothetical protein
MGKSPWSNALWAARAHHRMKARAEHDGDLTPEQRSALTSEAEKLKDLALGLISKGRELEDFLLWILSGRREDTYILDALCDTAQTQVWAILGLKQSLLASANTTRENVLGAPLATIKKSGRARTVVHSRDVVRGLRSLPEFPERDGLATKLERSGQALDVGTDALTGCETEASDRRVSIETSINTARTEVIRVYGRLLDRFPRAEVEALFPRRPARTTTSTSDDEPEEPDPEPRPV